MNNKLTMRQQCIFVTRKANVMLGCIGKTFVSKVTEMILVLYLALVRNLKCSVQFWTPQYKQDMDILEQVQ